MTFARRFARFVHGSVRLVLQGNGLYWAWLALLLVLIASGVAAYARPVHGPGSCVTAMRDQVSWGFYIGNFTFLVGVAAAAVVLVIPAYVYDWKPIREIVILGELLAVSAIVMCLLFVTGGHRPARALLAPDPALVGHLNLPSSILAWDVLVLNVYLVVNFVVVTHILYRAFCRPALRQAARRAAGAAVDPDGGRHPHRDRVPLQRPGRAARTGTRRSWRRSSWPRRSAPARRSC